MAKSKKQLHKENLAYVNSAALFETVAERPWAIFLDSGVSEPQVKNSVCGRYDVLAMKPNLSLVFDEEKTEYFNNGARDRLYGDPIAILRAVLKTNEIEEPEQGYLPGAYGYFSYDLARQFEDLPSLADDDEKLPPMALGIYFVIVEIDHQEKRTTLKWLGDDEKTQALVQEWRDFISCLTSSSDEALNVAAARPDSHRYPGRLSCSASMENMSRDDYQAAFDQVRKYTVDGDCYQVNLTKRFSSNVEEGDPWLTYRALRDSSPAPYGSYMNLPFAQILSNSPEQFISCRDRQVTTSPIKGTRPRVLDDEAKDAEVANDLKRSPKDCSENVMIVDLMRNDLSRCCELNSVKVPELFGLYHFANVHHLISKVTGTLRPELHALDLFKSCFPGGSVTGAPKIRAMEIIEELEPNRRGLYCGAVGYIGFDGSMETSIPIRTIVIKDGVARYGAGGGLVVESTVDEEYQELLDKASMMDFALQGIARRKNA